MRTLLLVPVLLALSVVEGLAAGPAMIALQDAAADPTMASVVGENRPAAADVPLVVIEGAPDENRLYGETVKRDAEKGRALAVAGTRVPMRIVSTTAKLPFAAIGGVFGGIYGGLRSLFAKDDDDHNNSVGAGFMLGASAVGQVVGKFFEMICSIPVVLMAGVGTVIGGLVGLVRGLFN